MRTVTQGQAVTRLYKIILSRLARKKKKMEESKMSEEFHDWLDKCPVQWHREKADDDSATYTFIKNND